MYTSDANYVLTADNATYCVCFGPNSLADAAKVAALLNDDAMNQRLPHPAADMMPKSVECMIGKLHGPCKQHD